MLIKKHLVENLKKMILDIENKGGAIQPNVSKRGQYKTPSLKEN